MHKLIGKEVEVVTGDITYRGILIETGENEIQLQTQFGWISVPIEKIVNVKVVN